VGLKSSPIKFHSTAAFHGPRQPLMIMIYTPLMTRFWFIGFFLIQSALAFAHPGHGPGGFLHGFFHPLSGLDHLLVALAVGALAMRSGEKKLYLFPTFFLASLIGGAGLALVGLQLPIPEFMAYTSLFILGGALLKAKTLPSSISIFMLIIFGIWHGNIHVMEMPDLLLPFRYCLGFIISTGILHLGGIAMVAGGNKMSRRVATQRSGSSINF
jgi:urease accessory protein